MRLALSRRGEFERKAHFLPIGPCKRIDAALGYPSLSAEPASSTPTSSPGTQPLWYSRIERFSRAGGNRALQAPRAPTVWQLDLRAMIELSGDTKCLIEVLLPPANRERITKRILDEVSENIPFCADSTPETMERIRFSVIRLLHEGQMAEDDVFTLAYVDWRDLFMAAGHAGVDDHEKWAQDILA